MARVRHKIVASRKQVELVADPCCYSVNDIESSISKDNLVEVLLYPVYLPGMLLARDLVKADEEADRAERA